MRITKQIILASTAIGFAGILGGHAHAQSEGQPKYSRFKFQELSNALTEAETKCWNGNPDSYKNYMKSYQDLRSYLYGRAQNSEMRKAKRGFGLRAKLAKCPPSGDGFVDGPPAAGYDKLGNLLFSGDSDNVPTQKNQRQDRASRSNVRLSGYGRFGLDYNDANSPPDGRTSTDNSDTSITSRLRIRFDAGATQIDIPQAGYGVRFLTSSEKFIAKTDDSLSGYTIGGSLAPGGSFALENNLEIYGSYTNAKGTSEGSVANGTDGVGIVYHDRASNGSTGLGLGPSGMDVKTKSITERLRLQFDMSNETDGGVTFGGRVRLGAGVEFTDTKHEATITTPSFNDISSTSEQDLNEAYFFGSLSTGFSLTPNTNSLSLILMPMLEAGYRHAKLASEQHNVCGLCGPDEQDFRINIRDDDSGFYYGAKLSGELSYKINDTSRIGLNANYGYRSHAAEIINTETGDDLFIRNSPTHLETDSEYRMGIEAFLRTSF